MKKITLLIALSTLTLAISGCGSSSDDGNNNNNNGSGGTGGTTSVTALGVTRTIQPIQASASASASAAQSFARSLDFNTRIGPEGSDYNSFVGERFVVFSALDEIEFIESILCGFAGMTGVVANGTYDFEVNFALCERNIPAGTTATLTGVTQAARTDNDSTQTYTIYGTVTNIVANSTTMENFSAEMQVTALPTTANRFGELELRYSSDRGASAFLSIAPTRIIDREISTQGSGTTLTVLIELTSSETGTIAIRDIDGGGNGDGGPQDLLLLVSFNSTLVHVISRDLLNPPANATSCLDITSSTIDVFDYALFNANTGDRVSPADNTTFVFGATTATWHVFGEFTHLSLESPADGTRINIPDGIISADGLIAVRPAFTLESPRAVTDGSTCSALTLPDPATLDAITTTPGTTIQPGATRPTTDQNRVVDGQQQQ